MLEVGVLGKPHGVAGELRVWPHWEGSTSLEQASQVQLELLDERLVLELLGVRTVGKGWVVRLAGVESRDQAGLLVGARVLVQRDELEALAEDEYYVADLIGAEVVGPDGPLGQVIAVNTHPSVDTLVIRTPDGRKLEQVLGPPWVREVDTSARRVVLESLDGVL